MVEHADNHHKQVPSSNKLVQGLSIIFFSLIAGFLGAWIFTQTGLVQLDSLSPLNSTTREKIVSQEGEVMANIATKVSPSVVSVTTQSVVQGYYGRSSVSEGAGTGMIISKDGYILTNKHVASNASSLSVVTSDGKVYKDVQYVGSDPLNDVAFLKIKTNDTFTPVSFADSSDIKVGEKVVAIGNALGEYQNSVTTGIVSGIGRPVVAASEGQDAESLDNLIQTDAAINPGNSGGPLLNLSGQVIGMNTAVAQDAQGIGFAIPSNAVRGLIKNLLATGKVQRAYLGVQYINITPAVVDEYKLSVKQGAYIYNESNNSVVSGSPADKAGLKDKDVITKVNNTDVTTANGLAVLLAQFAPGDKVSLTVVSGGSTKTVQVTLSEYSAP